MRREKESRKRRKARGVKRQKTRCGAMGARKRGRISGGKTENWDVGKGVRERSRTRVGQRRDEHMGAKNRSW